MAENNTSTIAICPKFLETSNKYNNLSGKIEEFIATKKHNPLQRFGASDSQFSNDGPLGKLKISHAHLTHDVSILYRIKGSPATIYLFGLFSHKESGTDKNNPNRNVTKTLAKTLSTQFPDLKEDDFLF